jgi:trans-L-3-hydroxyproline dehydratase
MKDWNPPDHWLQITTIDAHTAGEPFRVITGGLPELPGDTILARRRYMKDKLDHLRTALMWEPRGHADMYGCIVTPPVTPGADFGILFLHNEGYSTMCGHGIIGIVKVVLETGFIQKTAPKTTIRIDSPAGLVTAHARIAEDAVQSIYFENVPSFVLALDEVIEVPGIGEVGYDIAFGGAFYAYVQAASVGLTCTPQDSIFIGPAEAEAAHSRNVCIFAEGEVDRSPTGTGVSGRLAIHRARKEIDLEQSITIESIIGSSFTGRIIQETTFGPYAAFIPQVEGMAHITGRHEFLIDPADPLQKGFILR